MVYIRLSPMVADNGVEPFSLGYEPSEATVPLICSISVTSHVEKISRKNVTCHTTKCTPTKFVYASVNCGIKRGSLPYQ